MIKHVIGQANLNGSQIPCSMDVRQEESGEIRTNVIWQFQVQHVPNPFTLEGVEQSFTIPMLNTTAWWSSFGQNGVNATLAQVEFAKPFVTASTPITIRFWIRGVPTLLPYFYSLTQPSTLQAGKYSLQWTQPTSKPGMSHVVDIHSAIAYGDLEDLIETVKNICWLLSFATGWLSDIGSIEAYDGQTLVFERWNDVSATFSTKPYVIPDREIWLFVEQSYDKFVENVSKYSLRNLIHLGLLAKVAIHREIKSLIMADWLEVIRYHFAKNVGVPIGNYIYDESADEFLHPIPKRTETRSTKRHSKNKRASFKEILVDMTTTNSISGWDDDFIDFRNSIIHTGGSNTPNLSQRYRQLHHFCDRVVLALLDWNEHYVPIVQPAINRPHQFLR